MSFDPIPTVDEASATGETAAIFAELRRATGMSFVNLIWRHLAALPDGLSVTWGIVAPLYRGPHLEAEAARLRASVAPVGNAPLPDCVWDAVGVTPEHRVEIANLIGIYNRANSLNLIALLVAAQRLRSGMPSRQRRRAPHPATPADRTSGPASPVRPLPSLGDLSRPLRDLVVSLDRLGRVRDSEAIESLYRHLAYWPPFLALAYASLQPLHAGKVLQSRQTDLIENGRDLAASLGTHASDARLLFDPASHQPILAAIEEFTGLMIGRMVVIGEILVCLIDRNIMIDANTP